MDLNISKHDIDTAAMESDVELRSGYSGRGMYGAECWAVVGDRAELTAFEQHLAKAATLNELNDTGQYDAETAIDAYMEQLETVQNKRREDSMGMNHVWYYPSIDPED